MLISLTDKSRLAWAKFLNNQQNYGHVNRGLVGIDIDEHVKLCMNSSDEMVVRVKSDLPSGFEPSSILEVGSSAGLNCYALKAGFPGAQIIGIEPEAEAIETALSMKINDSSPEFILGVGEDIPLEDGSVDLIICHTVIEHVRDVPQVIREFSRVLSINGVVHLDAPNYVWPYEPHLQIWTMPLFGKWFVKWTARLQGKGNLTGFLEHLQFVTPFQLERLFKRNEMRWTNRAELKLLNAANGTADIKRYKFASSVLSMFGRFGISKLLVEVIGKLGLYPSVMYTMYKSSVNTK